MEIELIEQTIEETFPEETNLIGRNSLNMLVSSALNGSDIVIEETKQGDQLNYYEVSQIIIEAATFIIALLEFLKSKKVEDDLKAEEILQKIDSKEFKKLNNQIKLKIINKLL